MAGAQIVAHFERTFVRLRQRCHDLKATFGKGVAHRGIPTDLLGRLRLSALAGAPLRYPGLGPTDDDAEDVACGWRGGERPAGSVTREIAGLRWTIPHDRSDDGSLSYRMREGGWLPFKRIQEVRQFTTGGVMLDIGANIGTTAIPRVILGDCSHVYAAEPHPENFACLVGNVLDNGLDGYVLPSRVAISSRTGVASLTVAPKIGSHSLRRKRGAETVEVPCMTLDGWVKARGIDVAGVRFVKIDVQGHEGHVLLGARELAGQRPILWQVEWSPSWVAKSGVDLPALYEWIGQTFGWVHVLGSKRPPQPAREVAAVVHAAAGRRYADILLGHGELRDLRS